MAGIEDWDRLDRAFAVASALPRQERTAWVRRECAGDPVMESRLRRMLELDKHDGILDSPIDALIPEHDSAGVIGTLIGRKIGKYQLVRIIGSGGMGIVYEALQDQPHRPVAIKVLHAGVISRAALRRFEQEAEILGRLQHPGIARIYEAGVFETDAGPQPFFAMELLEGLPLNQYAGKPQLGTRARVSLLVDICLAVEHAHDRGIIHRDLKPANILIVEETLGARCKTVDSREDAAPLAAAASHPKILDFGIARTTDSDRRLTTLRTDMGQLLGTLTYMSPEQMAGDPSKITFQSDVYALGVIGYELLSGRLPHDLRNVPLQRALRIVCDDEPTPLSSIHRMFRGDLDTIIAKAIEKDPTHRFLSVADLRRDLQRYLDDQPIQARPPTTGYQLRKFARRNKSLVCGTIGVFLVLLLGIAGMGWQWSRTVRQRNRAVQAEKEAEARTIQVVQAAIELMQTSDDSLSELPGGTRAWEAMTQQALDQLTAVPWDAEPQAPTHTNLRYIVAYAHHRVGEVALVRGRISAGLESFQKALAIRQQLVEQWPTFETFVRTLGVGHWKVAEALIRLGRMNEAGQHLQTSLGIYQQSMNRWLAGDLEAAGIYLGGAHRRIGELHLLMGDARAAESSFRGSLKLVNAGLARKPMALNLRRGKATTLRGLGETLLSSGDHRAAIGALEECDRIIQALREESTSPELWELSNQALTHLAMGKALAAEKDPARGLELIRGAMQIGERLSRVDPDNLDARYLTARCRSALGVMLNRTGEADQADREMDVAIKELDELSQLSPESVGIRKELLTTLVNLGAVHEILAAKFVIDSAGRKDRLLLARSNYQRGFELLKLLHESSASAPGLSEIEKQLIDGMARIAKARP